MRDRVIEKWSGRKLGGFIIIFLVATWFAKIGILSGGEWVDMIKWIFITFVAGNLGVKFIIRYLSSK